jgi:Holliday junction resolvase-like predicted endonuclease
MFLAAHRQHADAPVRFDVVAIEGSAAPEWLAGAFEAEDAG